MQDPLLLTVDQCAERLNLGRSLTYRFIQTGELASIKLGRARRIQVSALQEFVERLANEQALETRFGGIN